MQLLPAHNADLPGKSKCRLIPELFSINAPVAVRFYVQSKVFVVFTARFLISIAHQSRGNEAKDDSEDRSTEVPQKERHKSWYLPVLALANDDIKVPS